MLNQVEMTNHSTNHNHRVVADQQVQHSLPLVATPKPTPPSSSVIAQELYRLLRQRNLRCPKL